MQDIQVLIVDDHALFRTGLQMILTEFGGIEFVHEAGSVAEATSFNNEFVSIILLDIQMPGLNGLEGIKILKEKFEDIPIIVLSASQEESDIQEASQLGAQGFLNKTAKADSILSAISKVLKGDTHFPVQQRSRTVKEKRTEELTARQLEVLTLLCEGKPNKLIARELDLSENTVRVHVSAILSVLNVSSRSEAMLVAQKQKLIRVN